MTIYSELVVLILMLPVVTQILIPLLILAGFGLKSGVTTLFKQQKSIADAKNNMNVVEKLQLSGS